MVRNQNGYWMSSKFYALYAPDDGGGNGAGDGGNAGAAGDNNGDNGSAGGENTPGGENPTGGSDGQDDLKGQLEKIQAEMARQKAALDKATHEASEYKKQLNESKNALKAKMTQEEIDAANKKELDEKNAQELEELRRKVSKAENTKSVMGKLKIDEDTAGQIAESMTGCENIENALLLIQKVMAAKEAQLRKEFGRVPPPGAGGGSEDKEMQAALAIAKEMGENRAKISSSVREQLKGLVR